MATTTTDQRPVGTKVSIDDPKFPGIWTVKSNGPVNAVLTPENGGRGLRVPHYMLLDPQAAPVGGITPPTTYFHPGEFVRISGGKYAGVWMVLADPGKDTVRVVKPGGDGGRYLRATRRGLVKVDACEVLK